MDKEEALEKVRIALEVYLRLPSSPVHDEGGSDIAIQRLESNIFHLKSELKLSHALMQAKDAAIQAQQFTIEGQRRLLSGEIIIASARDVTPKPKDKDAIEFLDGLVALTPYEGKGFRVGLPEVFRRLKKLFADGE